MFSVLHNKYFIYYLLFCIKILNHFLSLQLYL